MAPSTSDPAAVLSVVKAFLAGIKTQDIATMRAQLHPGGTAVLIRGGKPVQKTLEEILTLIATPSDVVQDEVIHFLFLSGT